MLITSKRTMFLRKNTRDVETQTVPLSKIASVGVRSDYGASMLILGLFSSVFGLVFMCGGAGMMIFPLSGGGDAIGNGAFVSLFGLLSLTSGILSIVNRIATIIEVETSGGSSKWFTSSGSRQKNKITSAIERLNALVTDA